MGALFADLAVEARGDRHRRRGVLRSRRHRLDEIKASLENNWEEGQFLRGGSTITQQLAKNLYLSPSRNPMRKVKELLITRRLEAALTKQRIFEIYLNVIEWGDGIFGCEAAARVFRQAVREPRHPGSGADGRRDHQSARAQPGEADAPVAAAPTDHPAADGLQAAARRRGAINGRPAKRRPRSR